MEVTKAVTVAHGDRGPGQIVFRADDERLTPYAGLACVGELARRTGLVELIDAELATEGRAAPVKRRRRGVSGGELVVSLAESQLVGGECFDDIEQLRADTAGAPFRAVAAVPAAATALQLAKRFRRCLCQAVERGLARRRAAGRRAGPRARRGGHDRLGRDRARGLRPLKAGRVAQPRRPAELRAARRVLGAARPRADGRTG